MKPIIKFNGKRIHRDKVEKYWQSGASVMITLVSGDSETKDYDSSNDAEAAIAILDNLTDMDDLDGI